ncbi:MAG: biotin/lipoate A/B protein ligase family protein [Lysinibacillus sp.]
MKNLFQQPNWRFIDQSTSFLDISPLQSFAMDDTLCHANGHNLSNPTVRTWIHNESVVLGIQDHRLPNIDAATQFLVTQGFAPIVRNSGGLAVVLDPGVLNISLVFKDTDRISIDVAFEFMVDLIKRLLPELADRIEVYEIVGSYCPGTYDLSIGGQKFAGISQRRMQNGIAVQIYLCVEGSGSERAELIRQFYNIGLQGGEPKYTYPTVHPEVMASLQQLSGDQSLTATTLNERLKEVIASFAETVTHHELTGEELALYKRYTDRIITRNASLLK